MRSPVRSAILFFWLLLGGCPVLAQAEPTALAAGSRLGSLTAGLTTYQNVQVLSINARTLIILHEGGMTSVRLRDLSAEWQARFHYDPAADAAAELAAKSTPHATPPVGPKRAAAPAGEISPFDALLQKFGQPAALQAKVDLRPNYFQLELAVKSQGRRPSCSVFAIVSALEYQNAGMTGRAEKFSEEYLIWAVRKTLRRLPAIATAEEPTGAEDKDEGFTLSEVVTALRTYGIPLQAAMPNTFGRKIEDIAEPPPAVVQRARTHQRVFVHPLPGRDNATRINNIIHALNAGTPIPIGLAWPHYRSLRTGYLSGQQPMEDKAHAVTLVGYKSAGERPEDTVFFFKNSWGPSWGQGGYGTVTYGYLNNCLLDAVVLEVHAAKPY